MNFASTARLHEQNWTRLGFFAVLKGMRLSPAVLELDSMVVNIELTLASIVQGVALTFLIENTRSVLSIHGANSWLYALTGLCIIFIFWSRSILHTLTLIRWPLEFGHNFLYIACSLAECLLFTRLTNPKAWFELSMIYGIAVWLLFAYDLRMTCAREADPASETSGRLCQLIERDSWLNIRVLMPVLVVFNGLCAACVSRWPAFFIAQHGHLWLIAGQFLGLAIYLRYVLRFASRLAPIVAIRQEERRALGATSQTRD